MTLIAMLAGCAFSATKASELVIHGTVTWKDSGAAVEGALIVLLKGEAPKKGSELPEFNETTETKSGKDGAYKFSVVAQDGLMVQLKSNRCAWNSLRIPVSKRHYVSQNKVLIDLQITSDDCLQFKK